MICSAIKRFQLGLTKDENKILWETLRELSSNKVISLHLKLVSGAALELLPAPHAG